MYAVIETGGKQYKVAPGNTIKIETLDAEVGAQVEFDKVLVLTDGSNIKIGNPRHYRNNTGTFSYQLTILLDAFHHSGTDGTEADNSNSDFSHNLFLS